MRTRDLEKQDKMFSIIDDWKSSNKSKLEICKSNNISLVKFKYWYNIYTDYQALNRLKPTESFTKISPPEAPKKLELEYPNGVKIKIISTDLDSLQTLIKLWD